MSNNSTISVERVFLYANGTCEVLGTVEVEEGSSNAIELVIPERNASEVLSSLCVTGVGVSVSKPANVKLHSSTDGELTASGANPYALFEQLAGASVVIQLTSGSIYHGKLIGVVNETSNSGNTPKALMLKVDEVVKSFSLELVSTVQFDKNIQSKIDSALELSLQKISPASAVINLELSSTEGGTACISYVLSTNPWVMSYALYCGDSDLNLEAFAHVYNSTSEDWKNTEIVASTARPQDFIPLVRQPEIPKRKTVALGEAELDEPAEAAKSSPRGARAYSMSSFNADEGVPSAALGMGASESAYGVQAASSSYAGTVEYLADGTISVPAGSNSNINVLSKTLADAKRIAYYDDRSNTGKVLAALSGTNTTGTLLTRGAGVVHGDGRFLGRCIVPELREGDEFFIPYGRESRVTVSKDKGFVSNRHLGAIKIGEGVIRTETYGNGTSFFEVANRSDREFTVVIDFYAKLNDGVDHEISSSTGLISKTEGGYRLSFALDANESKVVAVSESIAYPAEVTIESQYQSAARLIDTFLVAGAQLEQAPEFQQYIAIRSKISDEETSLASITAGRDRLLKDMDLLKSNLSALANVPGQVEQVNAWGKDLIASTNEHKRLGKELSELNQKLVGLRSELKKALEAVSLAWSINRGY
jgi:hypothetical protein